MALNPRILFPASYDRTTTILSAVVCALVLIGPLAIRSAAVTGLSLLVIVVGYAWSPRGYSIEDGTLVIRRLIGAVRVPLEALREVRLAGPEDFRGCVRLWGSGGLFGYYGLFRTSALGRATWYMTHRSGAVILVAEAEAGSPYKTILISPDDPEEFLAVLRAIASAVPAGRSSSGDAGGRATGSGPWRGALMLAIIAGGLGLAGLAVAAAAMLYNPGPPSYTLTPGMLAIRDRFYPVTLDASSVNVPAVRIVNLAEDPAWRPALRVGGFANRHYQSGWFRTAGGKKMRFYRAGADRRLVLLPPSREDGDPVLLDVDDPDQFVEQLQRGWGVRQVLAP